jgi:hypothetical protein
VRTDLANVNKELAALIGMHSSNLTVVQNSQSSLIASIFSQIGSINTGLAGLSTSKADVTTVNALSDRVTQVHYILC